MYQHISYTFVLHNYPFLGMLYPWVCLYMQVFMQADFTLEDPATFQEVIPISQLLPVGRKKRGMTREQTQQTSKLLHEKVR